MDHGLLKTLSFFALLLAGVYLLGSILLPFLSPVAWALIVGIITFPLYQRFRTLCKNRVNLASSVMTIAVMLVLVLPTIGMLAVLVQEVTALYRLVETSVNSGATLEMLQRMSSHPWVTLIMEKLRSVTGMNETALLENLTSSSRQVLGKLLGFFSSVLANSFVFIFDMIFMLFILFFVYRDGEQVHHWLDRKTTLEGHRFGALLPKVVTNVLSGFIFGTLLTTLLQGLLAGFAYWTTGVPSPLLLALLTAVCGFIPVVGTAIIWLPAAIYLFVQGSTAKAVFLVLWGLIVVGMSDNIVRPLFMSSKVSLPILPLMIGVFGGLAAFGLLGAIFGPLLLAVLYELFVLDPLNPGQEETKTKLGEPI